MSRSYKKTPIVKDNSRGSNKKRKKIANTYIRSKLKDEDFTIANGSAYKKEFESYNIYDWKMSYTEEEILEKYRRETDPNSVDYTPVMKKLYPTEKDILRWWRKHYKNK